jgi:hypothetical protein
MRHVAGDNQLGIPSCPSMQRRQQPECVAEAAKQGSPPPLPPAARSSQQRSPRSPVVAPLRAKQKQGGGRLRRVAGAAKVGADLFLPPPCAPSLTTATPTGPTTAPAQE